MRDTGLSLLASYGVIWEENIASKDLQKQSSDVNPIDVFHVSHFGGIIQKNILLMLLWPPAELANIIV